ncbi:MAG: GTPase HflX [Gallionellales bacterium 35-53-114]|jgi:GTP-binding protein HflX|nr:MAG: GTPase HflX [Gallionellales bacterium 35-53-114]OYZ64677.1 MAG: GTPase HflX [Gallionellales bacterium 24-53-125]OZB07784.1 MAG: GTPase HflX [Gallionellales bacterium 39-52-133]HQS58502.1 GTPase HflX [Gallionellaceae bacterium]HQS74843.1 GTPase HflX [Gallionellaceae bacterium]
MHESTTAPNTAILVSLDFGAPDYAESLEEFRLLVESAGVNSVALVGGKRQKPDPKLFAGSGKVDEIAAMVEELEVPLVIFNHDLSPSQMRNLAAVLNVRVIDRTMLILDIFALRAQSHEGKVQVELAQLKYLSSRLAGMNQDMGQQKFAVGARGPGETQLELDKRKLERRVLLLNERLEKLRKHRQVLRKSRDRSEVLSISIVGYTNAGKSTLFNKLTHANVYAADQLFATLDTTARRMFIEGEGQVVLSDTVGFIRHLPHGLVAAFRSTLEETAMADLLLHVVDANSPERHDQVAEVNKVLHEIGADKIPQILIYNKIDLQNLPAGVKRDEYGKIVSINLSAKTGAGLDDLRGALAEVRDAQKQEIQVQEWHPLND